MDMTFLRASVLATFLLLTACDSSTQPAKIDAPAATVLEGKTMGTFWRVSVMDIDKSRAEELRGKIQAQLDADDQLLSTYKNDSALMRFNRSSSTSLWPVSEAMADIVTESMRVGYKTNGAMDVTVGPLVNLWGFGPNKQPVTTPDQAAIDDARARTGLQHLAVISQYGQQYLQKDIPDLFVDLSTVGCGSSRGPDGAGRHSALSGFRRGRARQPGHERQRQAVASGHPKTNRSAERGAGDCRHQRARYKHLRKLPQLLRAGWQTYLARD